MRPALEKSGFKFFGHLDLPPGAYTLRVLTRNGRTGQASFRAVPLVVSAFDAPAADLLPPLFHEPPGKWLLVREATRGTEYEGRLFLVGGYVRDKILGRPQQGGLDDIDLVLEGSAEQVAWLLYRRGASWHKPTVFETFGTAMDTWLANAPLADSTRAMRKHIIDRDILQVFQNRLLTEIQAEDLRALCNKVKERGAPATAVQIRDIVKQVWSGPTYLRTQGLS